MIYYVLDTSVIIPNYFDPPKPQNPQRLTPQEQYELRKDRNVRQVFAYICSQWLENRAKLIVPNFVIAEFLNFFACHHYRELGKLPHQAQADYDVLKDRFISQIKYYPDSFENKRDAKKWFFNYELNRHHILNLDKIFPIEHTTEPLKKGFNTRFGEVYLSPFDLLLISVALELEVLVGRGKVFILTIEKRLANVCSKEPLPKCYKVDQIKDPKLQMPRIDASEIIVSP